MPSYAGPDINSISEGVDQVTNPLCKTHLGKKGTEPLEAFRCASSVPMELGPKPRDRGIPPLHLRGCLRNLKTGTLVKEKQKV